MRHKQRLIIITWAEVAFVVWAILYNCVVFFLIFYLQNHKGQQLSTGLVASVQVVGIAGLFVAPTAFAWLGVRGKLPATRHAARKGFEVLPPATKKAV